MTTVTRCVPGTVLDMDNPSGEWRRCYFKSREVVMKVETGRGQSGSSLLCYLLRVSLECGWRIQITAPPHQKQFFAVQ